MKEINIILLQEVTLPVFDDIRGFTAYTNIGTTGWRTATLTRGHIQLTKIVCLPTGRRMVADFQNVTIVNIHAPSEAERRRNKENIFSNEVPYLIRASHHRSWLDFNSVLTNLDAAGHSNYSRGLQEFIRGFVLIDKWATSQKRTTYTHYNNRGSSKIDTIYGSRNLSRHKRGAETRIPAFTDLLAVVLRSALESNTMQLDAVIER